MWSFPPIEQWCLLLEPRGSGKLPALGVDGLGNAAQKHCCSSDILAGPGELWDIVPLVHDVVLDLTSATPGATRRAMRMGRNVPHRPCQRRRRLALPPLS